MDTHRVVCVSLDERGDPILRRIDLPGLKALAEIAAFLLAILVKPPRETTPG